MRETSRGGARVRGSLLALALAMLPLGGAAALNAPTITAPTSGSTVYTGTPTLQWVGITGVSWYLVWLSQGSSGPNVLPCAYDKGAVNPKGCWIQDIGTHSLPVASPLALGTHTLWMLGQTPNGSSRWSTAVSFTVATRFEDRGKTVFDHQTNLEWEKKTTDGTIHDAGNRYTWSTGTNNPDGTAFTVFLAGLNAGTCVSASADGTTDSTATDCSFAGHGDWRLPKVSELLTIVDCNHGNPCVDPAFGTTEPAYYWSCSSFAGNSPGFAWQVFFAGGSGSSGTNSKTGLEYVRAVRSGP